MDENITIYHSQLSEDRKQICDLLYKIIDKNLNFTGNKLWHGHPVWFIEGNPIVGYSSQKAGIKLMFWSGADFGDPALQPGSGKFKDASITYIGENEVNPEDVIKWLSLSEKIQWDYKNIVKRKGKLVRL